MEQISEANRTRAFVYVLIGGLVVGTLDITYACVFWALKAGVPPQRIFQSVARGVLGTAAFSGGAATAALGLFLHYFIAMMMSIAYYVVARKWTALVLQPLLFGALYGLVLYGVMNYVVIPLSAARGGGAGPALWVALSIVVHMFVIGVPIAFFARRAVRNS
ncbi:MAG TPA: hypothetical protein VFI24_16535 [Pyrinomonadaceae bacterium]|nr:hypothetical protein [Pyrinomonadaceae bacterium]